MAKKKKPRKKKGPGPGDKKKQVHVDGPQNKDDSFSQIAKTELKQKVPKSQGFSAPVHRNDRRGG